MKKIIAAMLAMMLVLSLCACSEEPKEPVEDAPEQENSEETAEPEIEEINPKRGTVTDGVYYNEVFGIGFEGDENWYYLSDEEIAATMGIAADAMLSEETYEAIKESGLVYDMYCVELNDNTTVNVNYENIGIVYGAFMDEEYYLEISKNLLEEQIIGAEMSLSRNEIGTVAIGEKEVPCLYVTIDFSGASIHEVLVPKKIANWMGVITVAASSEEAAVAAAQKIVLE